MFTYFDNRFAHDMPLMFHCADVKLRHEVNAAVSARVKSNPAAFPKFAELANDPNLLAMDHPSLRSRLHLLSMHRSAVYGIAASNVG